MAFSTQVSTAGAAGVPAGGRLRPVRLGKRLTWVFGVLLVVPWVVVWLVVRPPESSLPGRLQVASSAVNGAEPLKRTFKLPPGPWGDVKCIRIALEVPREFIYTDKENIGQSEWIFPGQTRAQVAALFQAAALSPPQLDALLHHSNWTDGPEGVRVHPDPQTVLELSPQSRRAIYSVLGKYWENQTHRLAFVFKPELLVERFEGSGIPPDYERQIRGLLYPQGRFVMFADLYPLLATIASPELQTTIAKVCSRQWTYLIKLRVDQNSNIDELSAFWGAGRRAKDVRPLLESLQRVPGGIELDITHLLPQFARRRIYTFPLPYGDGVEARRDCHWTAYNFFNDAAQPDDRFTEPVFVRDTFLKEYVPVNTTPVMGDLVVLFSPAGEVLHSATYIAGDLVFCKNGAHFSQPWMFMRLADMMDYYTAVYQPDHDVIPRLFRHKDRPR